jgi:hypothetical protein
MCPCIRRPNTRTAPLNLGRAEVVDHLGNVSPARKRNDRANLCFTREDRGPSSPPSPIPPCPSPTPLDASSTSLDTNLNMSRVMPHDFVMSRWTAGEDLCKSELARSLRGGILLLFDCHRSACFRILRYVDLPKRALGWEAIR